MAGWFACDADAWAMAVEHMPSPWPREVAVMDARWLHYEGPGLPSPRKLCERWGWFSHSGKPSTKRVRLLLASGEWRDKHQDERRARQGQGEGEVGASQEQAKANNTPAKGEARARQGRGEGHTRVETHSHSQSPPGTSSSVKIPRWVDGWRRGCSGIPDGVTKADIYAMVCRGVEIIMRKPIEKTSKGYGRPLLLVWARLEFPPIGDCRVADPLASSDPHGMLHTVALLRRACGPAEEGGCPHQIFRGHVQGVDGNGSRWRDPPRITPSIVCRLDPKAGSAGATIEDRLEVAREWRDMDYPTVWPGATVTQRRGRGGELPREEQWNLMERMARKIQAEAGR